MKGRLPFAVAAAHAASAALVPRVPLPAETDAAAATASLGISPKPTTRPAVPFWAGDLRKRQGDQELLGYFAPDNTCGYVDGNIGAIKTCDLTESCMALSVLGTATLGCCDPSGSPSDCVLLGICIDAVGFSSSSLCDSGCRADANTVKCTDSSLPYCFKYTVPGISAIAYSCDSVSETSVGTLLTTFAGDTESRTWTAIPSLTSGSSLRDIFTPPSPRPQTPTTTTTTTRSQSPTPEPPAPGGGSKTPVGAIVGGVVGGLAAIVAIVGIIVFYLLRRKRRGGQDPPPATTTTTNPNNPTSYAGGAPAYQQQQMQHHNSMSMGPAGAYDPKRLTASTAVTEHYGKPPVSPASSPAYDYRGSWAPPSSTSPPPPAAYPPVGGGQHGFGTPSPQGQQVPPGYPPSPPQHGGPQIVYPPPPGPGQPQGQQAPMEMEAPHGVPTQRGGKPVYEASP